ncbi:MAG TPA: Gfo/Idh/MocA family oxidoreductase [Acetobacteraceae bacterium]|jgi:predicted dehydrogenase|nr:Gfo/Idh/MocA family oxidoreductase [Acetobacteraceae bacterium]
MPDIGVGIIGTGFMGRAHAMAYRAVPGIFAPALRPVLEMIADSDAAGAERAFHAFGFRRMTTDWRALIADPSVSIVCITTPTALHREMALAAIAAGKHVHCEKPLALNAAAAGEMARAAEAAGLRTQVGFNYLKNPLLGLAREMIAAGELGEITNFRGIHAEGYMADPQAPWTWRLDPAGAGAIADIGSHIIGLARFLLGPIAELIADLETVIKERPEAAGSARRRAVEVDDIARLTLRFARGCGGTIEANWVATGRTMQLGFEVTGSRGALSFTQERMNELLFFRAAGPAGTRGFTRIEAGPEHPPYGLFCPAAGHQLGFNELKTIEAADFLRAIAGGPEAGPDFREGAEIQKVIDTALRSAQERRWLGIP